MSLPPRTFNTKSPTIKRILKEASELSSQPDATLHASPLESDLFEWHFTLAGPPSTPYAEGIYHGRITLPASYPLRPPSFRFLTPSGRFEVNREICLSISGHHEETWQPAWGIRTALWALRAFMEGGAKGQVGGMEMGKEERLRLARESRRWRCAGCGGRSGEEILREEEEKVLSRGEREMGKGKGQRGGERKEEEVPPELRFGFKDEMEKSGDHTHPPDAKTPDPSSSSSSSSSSSANHHHHHPQPPTKTNTTIPPLPHLLPPPPAATSATSSNSQPHLPAPPPPDSVSAPVPIPAWIDKAIAGVVAGLAIMIVRKILF